MTRFCVAIHQVYRDRRGWLGLGESRVTIQILYRDSGGLSG